MLYAFLEFLGVPPCLADRRSLVEGTFSEALDSLTVEVLEHQTIVFSRQQAKESDITQKQFINSSLDPF